MVVGGKWGGNMWRITEDYEDGDLVVDKVGILDAAKMAIQRNLEEGENLDIKIKPDTVENAIQILKESGYNVEQWD